jgi:hypothetical protein
MPTKNLVPRADNEGGIGTSLKKWSFAYVNTIYSESLKSTQAHAAAYKSVFVDTATGKLYSQDGAAGGAFTGVGTNSAELGVSLTTGAASYSLNMGSGNNIAASNVIAYGYNNTVSADYTLVFGGANNVTGSGYGTTSGYQNTVSGKYSSVYGSYNTIAHNYASVCGQYNDLQGSESFTFVQGNYNTASGSYGMLFGYRNFTTSYLGFALGMGNSSASEGSASIGSTSIAGGISYVIDSQGSNFVRLNAKYGDISSQFTNGDPCVLDREAFTQSFGYELVASASFDGTRTVVTMQTSVVSGVTRLFIANKSNGATENAYTMGIGSSAEEKYSYSFGARSRSFARNSFSFGEKALSKKSGQFAYGNDSFDSKYAGTAQGTLIVDKLETTNATLTEIMAYPVLFDDALIKVEATIVASRTDVAGDNKSWKVEALVDCSSGTPTIIGSPVNNSDFSNGSSGTWAVSVAVASEAKTPNSIWGSITTPVIKLSVTGEAGKTIRWVSNVKTTEVARDVSLV